MASTKSTKKSTLSKSEGTKAQKTTQKAQNRASGAKKGAEAPSTPSPCLWPADGLLQSISILCPTRGRPAKCMKMVDSIRSTQSGKIPVHIHLLMDKDDPVLYPPMRDVELAAADIKSVGEAWNLMAAASTGHLLMMGNDDLVWRTKNWDIALQKQLKVYKDGIFVAWGNDGSGKADNFCAFPMVSRAWYDRLGYFTPECFKFFFHDTWIADIGKKLERLHYVPEIMIEHEHFAFGKTRMDDTYTRSRARLHGEPAVTVVDQGVFNRTDHLRSAAAAKLRRLMKGEGLLDLQNG